MDLMELLKTRRSFRRFDQSRPVPDSVIQKIARAQQYASCSGNSQSLRYIMVSDPAAWEEGVGSCILGNVARVPLAKLLDLPEQMHVYTVVAFGYPTHRSTLREVEPSEDLTYYLDENRDYVVPRKKIEEVIQFR